MNYYKVRMNYIPDYNDEKGICMNLLLVEDDLNLGKILKRQMEDHGITVTLRTTGKQGTELIYSGADIDIMVLDWMLPDMSGLDILNQLYFDKISIPVIMLTALGTLENKTAAFSRGADDYIVKPFEFDELLAVQMHYTEDLTRSIHLTIHMGTSLT